MKRTNLVLDEQALQEATRVLGVKTYSEAVNIALGEIIRRKKAEGIRQYFGTGIWQGNLSEMREDRAKTMAAATGKGRR